MTFLILLIMGLNNPAIVKAAEKGSGDANALRTIFFGLCFFTIGMVTNVRKLWAEGNGENSGGLRCLPVWVYPLGRPASSHGFSITALRLQ